MSNKNNFLLINGWFQPGGRLSRKNYRKVKLENPLRIISVSNQVFARCISVRKLDSNKISVLTNHGSLNVNLKTGAFKEIQTDRHPEQDLLKIDASFKLCPKVFHSLNLNLDQGIIADFTENHIIFTKDSKIIHTLQYKSKQHIRGTMPIGSRLAIKDQKDSFYFLNENNQLLRVEYRLLEETSISTEASIVADDVHAFTVNMFNLYWIDKKGSLLSSRDDDQYMTYALTDQTFVAALSIHKIYFAMAIETGKSTTYHLGLLSKDSHLDTKKVTPTTNWNSLTQQLTFFTKRSDTYLLALSSCSTFDLFTIKRRRLVSLLDQAVSIHKSLIAFEVLPHGRSMELVVYSEKNIFTSRIAML